MVERAPWVLPAGRVAIVGAGVAGLTCARTLLHHGVDVVVFDKGRRPGGRLASVRSPELAADLGAQYFTVRDERFGHSVRSWVDEGVVERWNGRVLALPHIGGPLVDPPPAERFVGTPSMSAIARHLGREVAVRASHRVDEIERRDTRFVLSGTIGASGVTLGPREGRKAEPPVAFGDFDVLLVCLPADQVHPLIESVSPSLAHSVTRAAYNPCLALGVVPDGDVLRGLPFDGLFVGMDGDPDRILAWLARDSSKPKRSGAETWVVHAAPDWSRAHLRDPAEAIERALLDELARILGLPRSAAKATTLRRWSFAHAPAPLEAEALFDEDAKVGVGGDLFAGGNVEGAFLSGLALACRVLGLPSLPFVAPAAPMRTARVGVN